MEFSDDVGELQRIKRLHKLASIAVNFKDEDDNSDANQPTLLTIAELELVGRFQSQISKEIADHMSGVEDDTASSEEDYEDFFLISISELLAMARHFIPLPNIPNDESSYAAENQSDDYQEIMLSIAEQSEENDKNLIEIESYEDDMDVDEYPYSDSDQELDYNY